MPASEDDETATVVYTDGACHGNPGPGGWAWAVPGGRWASGYDPATTNQRMELRAVLAAVEMLDGRLDVVTDSTYVANCFRDGWWKGWQRRGWRNTAGAAVANRDLWEPLVAAHQAGRFGVPRWVKGHSGDAMNDVVDRLAVAACRRGEGAGGEHPPGPDELGAVDEVRRGPGSGPTARLADLDPAAQRAERRRRDGRIPAGTLCVVGGQRSLPDDPATRRDLRRRLAELLAAHDQMVPDLVVLTGLRPGAEALAADAAADAGVAWMAVLPWPDPQHRMAAGVRDRFLAQRAAAPAEVVLERSEPPDVAARTTALARRDAWLTAAADLAVVVWDGEDDDAHRLHRRLERALGDDVTVLW